MLAKIQETASFIRERMHTNPETAIILGTGLGSLVNEITEKYEVQYKDIPNFPLSTVEGHSGKLIFEKDTGREKATDENFELAILSGENSLPFGSSLILSSDSTEEAPCIKLSSAESLIARNRREGDKILSGGMHKSVKKLMCDKKIPLSKRKSLPVVCDKDGILWIPFVATRDGANNKNGIAMQFRFCIFNLY